MCFVKCLWQHLYDKKKAWVTGYTALVYYYNEQEILYTVNCADPPNCVCGTVSLERINTLLNTDREGFAPKNIFPQEQAIFPNINFTASGRLLRWIVGGTYMNNNPAVFPEVQLWRPTGDTTYQKLNGTTVIAPVEIRRGIYEFPLDRPLTFQAGDVLGLFQPPLLSSRLLVDYDTQDHPTTYYIPLNDDQVQPFHTLVDISEWQTGSILPLVSVVIGEYIQLLTISKL